MEPAPRQHEAVARQYLAESLAAAGLHAHAGPDRRELVLNDLVEGALQAYEGFRRLEQDSRRASAARASAYEANLHEALRRTARIHLEIGRCLVAQLDAAANDGLAVRNALPFRQAFAGLVALENLDHGLLPAAICVLATAAQNDFSAGNAQQIDPDDHRNGIDSYRTWDFIKRTASLPNHVQQLAEKRYRIFFAADDRHPALGGRPLLGIRRVEGEASPQLWSVEISFEHRAIAVVSEATGDRSRCYVWFWIGCAADL